MVIWRERERNVLFNDTLNTFYLRLYGERNVSFNDALNTFYRRLYGVRHMVNNHSDSERERERESNVLFNDTLNTFYFTVIWRQTYGK